jgi:sugar phosphate isomerase/epimerase
MKISAAIGRLATVLGDVGAIRLLAEAGFDGYDYSMEVHDRYTGIYAGPENEYIKYAENIREAADRAGIESLQPHAYTPTFTGDEKEDEQLFKLIVRSIDTARILGSHFIVIHPVMLPGCRYDEMRGESFEKTVEIYKKLEPYAEKAGVKIGVENMFSYDNKRKISCRNAFSSAEDLLGVLDALDSDIFTICLDTGHAMAAQQVPEKMAGKFGSKLGMLHIHDNDGLDDLHSAPFQSNCIGNWEEFGKALKKIGYSGAFSFETSSFIKKYPAELFPSAMSHIKDIGRFITENYVA